MAQASRAGRLGVTKVNGMSEKAKLASIVALINLILVVAINASTEITHSVADYMSAYVIFLFLVVSFSAICYVAWHAYGIFSKELDPAGQCIVGFILPFLTAFVATANWSAFSKIIGVKPDLTIRGLSQFDAASLFMLFVIFLIGGLVWGLLMKSEQQASKRQANIAAGYTILSYWFGFIISSWIWLFWDAIS